MSEENLTHRKPNRLFFKHIIRKVFLEDWLIKLVALAVTFALWLGVTGLSTRTTTRLSGVPLTLRFSSDKDVTNSPIQEIDVIISGDNRKIAQINKNDLVASVDLTDAQPGERVIQLTPDNVRIELPTGVKLDEIQPNRLVVRLEAVEEKEVPVKIVADGEVPNGFEIYAETVLPARIRVRGPATYIKSLTQIPTEKIDLSDRKADFQAKQTPLNVANPKATLLETVVDVTFRIGEKRIERLFLVPVSDSSGKKATVVLFGGRSLLNGIKIEDLSVEIVKNDAGEDTPQLVLPAPLQGNVEIRKLKVGA